jgi:uncharacterized protein
MVFEWDERKRQSNVEKHGLDLFDVPMGYEAPHIVVPSKFVNTEERFLAVGVCQGRVVTVVYTIRGESIRVISFRRARHAERKKYHQLYSRGA